MLLLSTYRTKFKINTDNFLIGMATGEGNVCFFYLIGL